MINDGYYTFWDANGFWVHRDYFFSRNEEMIYYGVTRMPNAQIPSSIVENPNDVFVIASPVRDIVYETEKYDIDQDRKCQESGQSSCNSNTAIDNNRPGTDSNIEEGTYFQHCHLTLNMYMNYRILGVIGVLKC